MKCYKCGHELNLLENERYCPKCGYPVNPYKDEVEKELHSFALDMDMKTVCVNGVRFDTVKAFSLNCVDRKCTLTVTKDDIYKAKF